MKFEVQLVPVTQVCMDFLLLNSHVLEAAVQRCSWERVFWRYAADLQGSTHTGV